MSDVKSDEPKRARFVLTGDNWGHCSLCEMEMSLKVYGTHLCPLLDRFDDDYCRACNDRETLHYCKDCFEKASIKPHPTITAEDALEPFKFDCNCGAPVTILTDEAGLVAGVRIEPHPHHPAKPPPVTTSECIEILRVCEDRDPFVRKDVEADKHWNSLEDSTITRLAYLLKESAK